MIAHCTSHAEDDTCDSCERIGATRATREFVTLLRSLLDPDRNRDNEPPLRVVADVIEAKLRADEAKVEG